MLPKIVHSYNQTWHSGIRSEPINVNRTNEKQLWWQMYWPKELYDPNKKKQEIKYVSLQLGMQNAVSTQPCVGKLGISLVLLNFLGCNLRLWFETP